MEETKLLFGLPDIVRRSGMSTTSVWEHFKAGRLPPPVKTGRVCRWDFEGYSGAVQYFQSRRKWERTK